MIKIYLTDINIHRNECIYRPILYGHADQFTKVVKTPSEADIVIAGHGTWLDKSLPLDEVGKYADSRLIQYKESALVLLDGQDSASLIGTIEVFNCLKSIGYERLLIAKPTIYANKDDYKIQCSNGRIYFPNEHGYVHSDIDWKSIVKADGLGWIFTSLLDINPLNRQLSIPTKDIDIFARYGRSKQSFEHGIRQDIPYNENRDKINHALKSHFKGSGKTIDLFDTRIPESEYNARMMRSRLVIAPFGYGEPAPRDFISMLMGCTLSKQDMSHLDMAGKELYQPYLTYIPLPHDANLMDCSVLEPNLKMAENMREMVKYVKSMQTTYLYAFCDNLVDRFNRF